MKKRIAIISVIFLVLAYIIFNAISYANATLTVHLETADTSNVGYGIGNPLQQGINIWDLRNTANKKNLYCIRADYSDTWNNDGRTTDVNYNLSYDLQNDREKILNYLTDNGNDGDELLKQLLNPLGNAYRQLLWLFDNAYLEEEDAETYLNNLGLYDSSLTSKDIIAVQKAAVWYFTNYRVGNNGSYNRKGSSSSWLYLTTDGGSSFRAISDIGVSGQDRNYEAQLLYDYLVTQAEEQAEKYNESNNYNLNTKPASVDTSGLTEQDGKYIVNAEISSDYDYNIVGPIVIDKNSTSDYSISMTVTNQSGTTIHSSNYSFVDKNGNSLGSVTLKDLVGRSGGFYVKVARNLATTVNIKIEITSNVTKKTLWLKGTESSNQIKLSGTGEAEQPIVEISEAPETETVELTGTPETINIPVTKSWSDSNNQDGLRPTSVTVTLYANNVAVNGKTLTLNSSNSWKGTFTDLPKYKNGIEITYTVKENNPPTGYPPTVSGSITNGFTVTNTHTPETIDIPVTKIWADNNNQDGIRPPSVLVTLYADGVAVSGKTLTLNSSNSWKGTFTDLPKYKNGNEIIYTVKEDNPPEGYTPTINGSVTNGFTVTNTHNQETIDIPVAKVWTDNDNQDGIRPASVTVALYADNVAVSGKTLTLNSSNGWKGTFTDLPKNKDGREIVYTVRENNPPTGYTPTVNGSISSGFTVTNTHTPETINIPVEKIWEDNNNQDGIRPASVIVTLYADNEAVGGKSLTLTSSNSWRGTFTNLPKYKDGEIIKYTVKEEIVPSEYEVSVDGTIEEGFTVTNTHIPETIDIPVTKEWVDNNNQDGIRPNSITVKLYADDIVVEGKILTLNASNGWRGTFTDLPKYKNGNEIKYTVKEDTELSGYIPTIDGSMADGFIITNTHAPETIEIPVTKVWLDNENQDKLRPDSVIITLYADEVAVTGKTLELNISNNWRGKFTGLPKYKDGKEIVYSAKEDEPPAGYTPSISGAAEEGFTVTNTHIPETIEIPVTKIWSDSENQDGIRPTSVIVALYADGIAVSGKTITLNSSNSWKVTFTDLPKYKDGKEILYTVKEDEPPTGYTPSISGSTEEGFIVTNTHTSENVDIPVEKAWVDNENQDGIRPDSISVTLYANDVAVEGKTISLNAGNGWKGTFADLPKYEDGEKILYTVKEDELPTGYTPSVSGSAEEGFIVTNTHIPETIEIPVTKVWSDSENQDRIRPDSVIVTLYADDVAVAGKTITLNAGNGWKGTFTDLPKYKNGNKIKYTVKEDEPPIGYTPSVSGSVEEGFTVTNTHVPDTIEIPVTKIWSDNGDQDGIRPTSVTVTLYANDVAVEGKTITLNTENQWKGTFADLPKYQDGKEIVYTVKEDNPPEGYTVEITGTIEEGFTVTNTHKPKTISIPVEKVWVDNENQDGIRPPEITVTLYANDMAVEGKTITLNAENEWKGTFADLPKYESGEEIKYTIKENDVLSGYKVAIGGTVTDGFTITNTHETDETSITVTKVWEDNNNQDGIRPPEITVTLYANEKPKETITLSEGKWTHTFTGLPVMENGTKINYTIDETEVPEEYEKVITGDATVGFIITNKYTPGETSVTVNKAWVDENDKDELRPDSVEIALLANGDEIQTATLTGDDWTHTFTGLPLKKDGVEIEYTVVEKTRVPGYTSSVTENSNNNFTITNTHKVEKIFDLALRKYITKINNNTLESLSIPTRVPNIDTSRLSPRADAATTTATYKHKKDPVLVAEGDIVTYEITIYNEGEKSGYASQIIDQLPTGLIYSPSTTVSSKDPEGNNKNTYNVTYDPTENKVIFDIVNTAENPAKDLQPFETKLDYETLEIKCKVVLKPQMGETNILTNVAWISGAYDTEDDEVAVDRDSEPENHPDVNKDNMEDYKGNENNKDDLTDKDYHYEGEQDDDDFEKLYVQIFDLSLRKFIVKINDDEYISKKGEYIREPIVDVSPLVNKTDTTAIYNHPKEPVGVKVGDRVTYVIRVYNEGELDGFASEVKDYLPPYLTFIEDSEINEQYGWTVSEDGRVVTTTYLTDKEISKFNGTELDYEDLQIECLVSEEAPVHENLTNIAEISEYKYGDTIVPEDIDSESDNIDENLPGDEDLPGYKDDEIGQDYVPGNEDDDDFEKIYVKQFDLALRKFITQVQDQNITNREPQVKYENGQLSYEHTKEPLTVHVGDVVTYTLRIYNEGEVDGYASEISDDIPEFLEFLPENETNINYMWKMYDENGQETDNVEEAKTVKTTYLARENNKDGAETNLLVAFNGTTLHYKDIKIAFRVKDPNSNTYIITNHAQISEDTDEDGKPVDDIDSTPDEWNEGEDDQDIENVKVEYFDLSLLKFVSKVIVIEDGKETVTETGYNGHEDPEPVVKVELDKANFDNVVVKFGYGITITNEGDIPGYATEITDYVPEGLRFESADNPLWTDEGNNVISTKQLENTLLQPGESATIEVILTWINSEDNLNEKTNTAEISEDDNPYDVPDRDSVPDNEIPGEDDIDIAKVILLVSTGTPKTYFILTLGLLTIVLVGVILIKKFVL